MIWSFIKKEILLFKRSPQELLLLIVMPLGLITILGIALGAFFDSDRSPITGEVALIVHSDEEEEYKIFQDKLAEIGLPKEVQSQIEIQAKELLPVTMLKDRIFENEELKSVLTLHELPASQLEEAKGTEKYSAIIEIPEGFSSDMLLSLFRDEYEVPTVRLYLNEGREMSAAIVEDVINSFQQQYSLWSSLGKKGLFVDGETLELTEVAGSVETLTKNEPISAFSYYTIGMSVMYVLFLAGTISSRRYLEKKDNVFDRIVLANVPLGTYGISIFVSTIILTALQLGILYGGAALFYGVHWPDIYVFLSITGALCVAIGSISVLLVAIDSRLNSESATKLFSSAFVAIFAFVGGSFTQVGNMSEVIGMVGNLTPNGAAMSAYLEVLQGAKIADISDHLFVLLVLSIVLLVAAWFIYPRKEGTA